MRNPPRRGSIHFGITALLCAALSIAEAQDTPALSKTEPWSGRVGELRVSQVVENVPAKASRGSGTRVSFTISSAAGGASGSVRARHVRMARPNAAILARLADLFEKLKTSDPRSVSFIGDDTRLYVMAGDGALNIVELVSGDVTTVARFPNQRAGVRALRSRLAPTVRARGNTVTVTWRRRSAASADTSVVMNIEMRVASASALRVRAAESYESVPLRGSASAGAMVYSGLVTVSRRRGLSDTVESASGPLPSSSGSSGTSSEGRPASSSVSSGASSRAEPDASSSEISSASSQPSSSSRAIEDDPRDGTSSSRTTFVPGESSSYMSSSFSSSSFSSSSSSPAPGAPGAPPGGGGASSSQPAQPPVCPNGDPPQPATLECPVEVTAKFKGPLVGTCFVWDGEEYRGRPDELDCRGSCYFHIVNKIALAGTGDVPKPKCKRPDSEYLAGCRFDDYDEPPFPWVFARETSPNCRTLTQAQRDDRCVQLTRGMDTTFLEAKCMEDWDDMTGNKTREDPIGGQCCPAPPAPPPPPAPINPEPGMPPGGTGPGPSPGSPPMIDTVRYY